MSVAAPVEVESEIPEPGAKGGLAGWMRGIRPRQVASIPFWIAATGLLLVGDIAVLLIPPQQFMNAARTGNLLTMLGVVLLVLAARLGASTAAQLRALQPHRRAILYLRSFKADQNPTSKATDEELLSRVFRTVGPFVAFEEPGEWLPEIGSAKMTVKNEEWQQVVSDQIRDARFVVLNMGRTPSFDWEVKRVLELAPPERVLIYFSIHANRDDLHQMYERFVEIAQPVLKHPLPPVDEIDEQRFIRFLADGRPVLFGPIEKPGTKWRKWVGISSFGIGLVVLRPLVIEKWRRSISSALAPLRPLVEDEVSETRLWGRLSIAAGAYLGGFLALLPMLAWNFWHAGSKRRAMVALAGLPLIASGTVNAVYPFFGFLVAMIVYLAWPLLMPAATRRHIAFGGPIFGLGAATLVIGAAFGLSFLLPVAPIQLPYNEEWLRLFSVDTVPESPLLAAP